MKEIEALHGNYQLIEKAIQYIDAHFKEQPSIDVIAERIGMSKYHFIRVFKEYVGVTPKQFLHSVTLNYAKEHIKESKSILDSSLDIGLSSVSRLHELFVNLIGVTPKEWREKGKDVTITYGFGLTPFGQALIAYTDKGICFLGFIDQNQEAIFKRFQELWENANLVHDDAKAKRYLENIFLKNKKYNLLVKGTNLQVNVWKALLNLPNGVIATYQDIANYIDKPNAVRAVASAIGKNHIGYLIPCHRVIAKSGAMSGYRWGIERKKILLAYEAAHKPIVPCLRRANVHDVDALCRFFPRIAPDELTLRICEERFGAIYVATHEDEVIGLLHVTHHLSLSTGEKNAVLESVAVDKAFGNQGIEASLVEHAVLTCKALGFASVALFHDEKSTLFSLCQTLGFKPFQGRMLSFLS